MTAKEAKEKGITGWQYRCSCGATFDEPTNICPICGSVLQVFEWDSWIEAYEE